MALLVLLSCMCLALSAGVPAGESRTTSSVIATGQLRKREITHSQLMEELLDVKSKLKNALQKQCPVRVVQIDELREKLLAMEAGLQATKAKMELHAVETEAKLEATQAALNSLMQSTSQQNTTAGSTFIRWGRRECTSNSRLVYSGVVGGSWYDHTGAAANHLCLTRTPEFDNVPVPVYYAILYGAEYEYMSGHQDHDLPCSVCRAPQSTTIMVPATLTCPPGWTTQYTGHLVAGRYTHKAATEYVCLDGSPEHADGGHESKNGNLFYYTITRCGSLPCPPYVDNKVVLCAVCSK